MPHALSDLFARVVDELASNLDLLPAVGGAVEDLERPDVDEIEDILINAETREVTQFLETPTPDLRDLYRPTPPLFRNERHLYRFFIDGSLRTYYLATGIEVNRSFPIELAQIGAAVMQRDDRGAVRPLAVRHRILLLIPRGPPRGPLGVSDTVWQSLKRLDTSDGFFEVFDTTERNVNTPEEPTIENLRTRAGGIARNRMHKLEIELIGSTNRWRDDSAWLILDGAVKLDEFIKAPYLVGVAKNFRKDPEFRFGRTRPVRKDISALLAGLPYAHRTVAFSFSNVADPSGTIEGIYGEVKEILVNNEPDAQKMRSWAGLLNYLRETQSEKGRWRGMFAGSSIGMFRRHLRRIVQTRQTGIFVESRARNEKLLGDELTNIKGGETYVVDIAKLADDEQTLVFGDILRTIYAVKAEEAEGRTEESPVPEKVIIFVDELNKYAPAGNKESPITQQVLDVAERGRSLGVILISAQQFTSAVHPRVTGNSATRIIGRTGSSELNAPDYRFLEQDVRLAVTRLVKGELLISHAVYRQPVKVIFPKPSYQQEQA
ncbi:MAG: ATP-binding protein [Chloroflexi bacterium]|nr:ATP-binding protein [Chloroflexota bacterium]